MFGHGILEQNIDVKGRVIIPAPSGIKPKDRIFIESCFNNSAFLMFDMEYYNKQVEIIRNTIGNTKNAKNLTAIREMLEFYNMNIIHTGNVDDQKRFLIPRPILKEHNFENKIIYFLLGDHMLCFPKKEKLEEYKEYLKESYGKVFRKSLNQN